MLWEQDYAGAAFTQQGGVLTLLGADGGGVAGAQVLAGEDRVKFRGG
ncbi:hypothetical protein ABZ871_25550 [Streptomyces populi]